MIGFSNNLESPLESKFLGLFFKCRNEKGRASHKIRYYFNPEVTERLKVRNFASSFNER